VRFLTSLKRLGGLEYVWWLFSKNNLFKHRLLDKVIYKNLPEMFVIY